MIIAFSHPRKGMEKPPVTLLLSRRFLLGVTEPTQETHWKMHCLISIAQGMAWYSGIRTRHYQICPGRMRPQKYCPSVRVSSQSPLLHQEGHQLFSCHNSLLLPAWQKRHWPWMKNQGTRQLQKTCILLSPGEKIIFLSSEPQNAVLWWQELGV